MKLTKQSIVFLLGAWIALLVLYWPARDVLLIDDGLSGLWEIKQQGWRGFKNSYASDGLYYVYYAVLWGIYTLFGLHSIYWFLLFTFLHALNAVLAGHFFFKLFRFTLAEKDASSAAVFIAVFFLFYPYQSENIVWAATLHYALSMFYMLVSLHVLYTYFTSHQSWRLGIVWSILLLLSLFTLEIGFFFLFNYVFLYVLLVVYRKTKIEYRRAFFHLIVPAIGLVIGYMFLLFQLRNHWIPHDRAGGESASIPHMITTYAQLMMKWFGWVHFYTYDTRAFLYELVSQAEYAFLGGLFFIATTILLVATKGKQQIILLLYCWLSALVLLLPFARVYFMYLFHLENDRYLYFSGLYFSAIVAMLVSLLPYYTRIGVMIAFIPLLLWYSIPAVASRANAGKVHERYLEGLAIALDSNKINILLNVPSYASDAYVFREAFRLPVALEMCKKMTLPKYTYQIAWYNAHDDADSVSCEQLNDSTWNVVLRTPGSWWMNEKSGAQPYENDMFHFVPDEWGTGYQLVLKNIQQNQYRLLLFSNNGMSVLED